MVEGKNRTLENMARTMMCESNVSQNLWAEAKNTANYVLNRCLNRPILKRTPYELFKGKKPNISYFRSFGCKCFVHNNGKNNLGKFDARSDEGIFVGYSMHSKAYRIYNKRTKTIEESIHVIFDESNESKLSDSLVQNLHLNKHSDEEEERLKETNVTKDSAQEHPLNIIQTEEIHPPEQEVDLHENQDEERRYKYKPYHPMDNLLTDINSGVRTRSSLRNFCAFSAFISHIEPKNYSEALNDSNWIIAMQDELN